MSLTYHTRMCNKCGNKFTIPSSEFCQACKDLGIVCIHKKYCLRCSPMYIQRIRHRFVADKIFYGTALTVALVIFNAIGGRIL